MSECRCGKEDCPGPENCVCGETCGCVRRASEVTPIVLSDARWARSEFPHPQVTLDFDADNNLIAVEVIGTPIKIPEVSDEAAQALVTYLFSSEFEKETSTVDGCRHNCTTPCGPGGCILR